jgi:hypothetical protein
MNIFNSKDNINYKLFEALPVLPEPGISIRELAKKLGVTPKRVRVILLYMPPEAPVYEDFGEIGRIK